ncbi:MAG TPA: CxxxxCH/CxxCH domain-containing protein, partial [Anaeromyxobacter sp.]
MRRAPVSSLLFVAAAAVSLHLCACSAKVSPAVSGAPAGACVGCHGGAQGSAPPASAHGATATTDVGVGAHQAHVNPGPFRKAIACDECHVVPATVEAPGHVDKDRADVIFGGLATAGGAKPTWNGASCSATYCHGGTLAGGSNTSPQWTKVDGSQVACGTCHGVPPPTGSGHPPVTGAVPAACSPCHPGTVRPDGTLDLARGQHIDGVLQLGAAACAGCHGDATRAPAEIAAAPPKDVLGNTGTTFRGVGAHQKHLASSTLRPPIACGECHLVPESLRDHPDGVVEMSWGPLAKAGGAAPSWNPATASCSATYCHGATLTGGTVAAPVWTKVDGTQSGCTACHGVPPPAPHPADSSCGRCHVGFTATSVNPLLHMDGYVQLDLQTCTSCHGDPTRPATLLQPAPPSDLAGNTSTSSPGVGAHLAHLMGTSLRKDPIACGECHPAITSTSHAVGKHLVVDVTFGTLATTGGAFPTWDLATQTCASTYCHGGTLAGGTRTSPVWTLVNGSQVACGACHGTPPPEPHAPRSDCGSCHAGYTSSQVNLATHLDGVLDVSAVRCSSCHGDPTRAIAAIQPAPPIDTHALTSPADRGVGAHMKHLVDGVLRKAVACEECHVVPTVMKHATGTVDVTFGQLASTASTPIWNTTALTCSGVYCHGATLQGGTLAAPKWTTVDGTQTACGACHGIPPPAPHVQDQRCGGCHAGYTATSVAIATHVDGTVQATGSCTSCHGDEARPAAIAPAPPRDTSGNVATTAVGVGAHQSHLAGVALRAPLSCSECHPAVDAATHPNGVLAIAFGPLARTGGAVPAWKASSSSCASTYCHGATLLGGALAEPVWTRVDGTQIACTSCHGIPPPSNAHAGMTAATACGTCHPGYTSASVDPAHHVDGIIDAAGTSCTSCHGDANRTAAIAPAPPKDTKGNTATTARGVGSHLAHLTDGPMRPAMACTECHTVPADMTKHPNATLVVTMAWGPLATTGAAAPVWNGTSCASTYCHGATLPGGTNKAPLWTKVDSTQAACGTCHGVPPPAPHAQRTDCGTCHPGYTSTAVAAATH